MKILIVEDDSRIQEMVSLAFEVRWPEATIIKVGLGREAVDIAGKENPDLVILDLGLPDIDGFEVLKKIRLFSNIPIIILTVRDEESDIVQGLEKGADDYVVKPFKQFELMSRAQALMRRYHLVSKSPAPNLGILKFGNSIHHFYVGTKSVNLTSTEGIILSHLMRNPEKIVSLSNLSELIWDTDCVGSAEAIRVYIRRIRKKIEVNPDKPKILLTHKGVGYSLHKPD